MLEVRNLQQYYDGSHMLGMGLAYRSGRTPIPEDLFQLFPVFQQMLQRRGGGLSGGLQQQLAIARALAPGPQLLILDEPTEGIQPRIIKDRGRVIRMQAKERGMAVLLRGQYVDFALELADHVVVMERGAVRYAARFQPDMADEIRSPVAV